MIEWIDHFFVYSEDLDNCIDAKPLHSSTSLSNHVPIFMNLKSTVHVAYKQADKKVHLLRIQITQGCKDLYKPAIYTWINNVYTYNKGAAC